MTAPQLALLETTMLKMERVDTWVLMMGGGSGVDVFLVGNPCWVLLTLLRLAWRLNSMMRLMESMRKTLPCPTQCSESSGNNRKDLMQPVNRQ